MERSKIALVHNLIACPKILVCAVLIITVTHVTHIIVMALYSTRLWYVLVTALAVHLTTALVKLITTVHNVKLGIVCSGRNGTCSSPNKCVCKSGFYGTQCEAYKCYGSVFNVTGVCSQNGTCVGPDTCNCNNGSTVCSGAGYCVGVNNCVCKSGYYGSQCEGYKCYGVLFNNTNVGFMVLSARLI
ncbi:Wnt inhibitory factor, partial [Acrasis kona]